MNDIEALTLGANALLATGRDASAVRLDRMARTATAQLVNYWLGHHGRIPATWRDIPSVLTREPLLP